MPASTWTCHIRCSPYLQCSPTPTAAHFLLLFLCLFQTASLVRCSHWKPGPFLFVPALVSSRHAQLTLGCISLSQPFSCQQNVSSTGTGILSNFCCFLSKQRDTYCKPIEWINSGIWSSCTRGVEDKGIYYSSECVSKWFSSSSHFYATKGSIYSS